MKKRILSVILCGLLVFSLAPVALAGDDTTAPAFIGLSINQSDYNIGDTIKVNVQCSDTESGLDYTKCSITADVCEGYSRLFYMKSDTAVITPVEGGFEVQYTIPSTFYGGQYHIVYISLWDQRENSACYSVYESAIPDLMFSVQPGYMPPQGPSITGFKTSSNTARVGDTVKFTITGSDSSGIVEAGMVLYDPGAPVYYPRHKIALSPVQGQENTFSGSFKIPADMPDSTYYPADIYIKAGSGLKTTVGLCSSLPSSWGDLKVRVINPTVNVNRRNVKLISYSLSSHELIPGQKLAVTVKIDPNSVPVAAVRAIIIRRTNGVYTPSNYASGYLSDQGNNLYYGTIDIPLDIHPGDFDLGIGLYDSLGNGLGLDIPDSFCVAGDEARHLKDGHVTIVPLLSVVGTDNKTILAGESFDPMQSVSAANAYTGDITTKVTVTGGNFDRNVPGLYLVKYLVNDTVWMYGMDNAVSYTDYRWIGVTEIMPEAPASNSDMPLAVTNESLAVGATSSDVTIKKNGSSIAYSNVVDDPGEYTLTTGGETSAASGGAVAMAVTPDTSSQSATAVIDRTGPVLSASWGKSGQTITVTVKASDMAGVAQLKYKSGSCSLDDCKNNGIGFSGSFAASGYGSYTLYARDKLGNESVKAIMVSSSSAGFAYLSGVNLTAGTLSRAFTPKTYSYKISLGENQPSVTLTPVKEWDGATMTINGKAVSNHTVNLANGKSAKVTVKVKYGKTAKTYKFSITRAKSGNNNLSGLTATAGSFNAAFSPSVTSYSLTLDENTKSTTIKAAVENPQAKTSPSSSKVTLKNGQSKTVKFTVKAQSGAKKTYIVTVTRAKSTNTALKYIKTDSSKYPLSPAFSTGVDSYVDSYTVTLPANKSKVTISAKAADSLTGVTVDGKKGSKKFTLANGQSITVKVVITAQSGVQKEYTVTINRL